MCLGRSVFTVTSDFSHCYFLLLASKPWLEYESMWVAGLFVAFIFAPRGIVQFICIIIQHLFFLALSCTQSGSWTLCIYNRITGYGPNIFDSSWNHSLCARSAFFPTRIQSSLQLIYLKLCLSLIAILVILFQNSMETPNYESWQMLVSTLNFR